MYIVYIYVCQDVYAIYNVCIWCISMYIRMYMLCIMYVYGVNLLARERVKSALWFQSIRGYKSDSIRRWGVLLTEHEMYHKINATFLGKILDLITTIDSKTPSSPT